MCETMNLSVLQPAIAQAIYDQIPLKGCKHCGVDLPNQIMGFMDEDGWVIPQLLTKMWLWIQCPQCHFQYSLWKLGYGRDSMETEAMKEKIGIWNGFFEAKKHEKAVLATARQSTDPITCPDCHQTYAVGHCHLRYIDHTGKVDLDCPECGGLLIPDWEPK